MKRRLNILYIVNVLRQTSSPLHEHVLPMSVDHNVVVCSYGTIETDLPPTISTFSGAANFYQFALALKHAARFNKYDIVHCHAPFTGALFCLFSIFSKSLKNTKTVFTVHSSYANYNVAHLVMLYIVFCYVDKIVHCSQASYDSFSKRIRSYFLKRRTVIPNGVNIKLVDKIIKEGNEAKDTQKLDVDCSEVSNIISIGRLLTIKNHSLLLRSLSRIKYTNFKLQIIGTGPLLDTLMFETKELGIDGKVRFIDALSREDVYRELAKSDLFVSASTIEGLPLSVLEALACACPVIISDIPAHREISHNQNCITIVNSNDTNGFISAIEKFFTLNPGQVTEIRNQSREHAIRNHSMHAMNEKYESLYKVLADN